MLININVMNKTMISVLLTLMIPYLGFAQAKTEIKNCTTILASYNGDFNRINSFEFILEKKN